LTVRRARLLFAGPIDQPYLDIEAIRKTDDVIAGIRLSGSAEQPTTQIFSEPAMSQEQALSYLVLGVR
jgi:translocation and assembly module TamB